MMLKTLRIGGLSKPYLSEPRFRQEETKADQRPISAYLAVC